MYHGVVQANERLFNTRHVSVHDFQKQLSFLNKHCNIISLESYFEQKFDPKKNNVAITFDDGYLNNFELAKPILESSKTPATFFVTGINTTEESILWADLIDIVYKDVPTNIRLGNRTFTKNLSGILIEESGRTLHDFIKEDRPEYAMKIELYNSLKKHLQFQLNEKLDHYWKLMSDKQLAETAASKFISIGSHGYFHNNLGNIALADAEKEILQSKEYLENVMQKEVNSIGYPDGSYSRETIVFCEKIGIKYQVATERYLFKEDQNDERILNRKGIYACDTWGNQLTY